MQGNQKRSYGPIMRSNCCCDSHSTTRRVSWKKGSISSAAWTQACSPPLLLLLWWDVTGFGGRRLEVDGWGNGVLKVCWFAVYTRTGGLRFWTCPPWDPFSKKCVLRRCFYRIRVDGRPKRCNTCAFSQKNVFVWTASKNHWFISIDVIDVIHYSCFRQPCVCAYLTDPASYMLDTVWPLRWHCKIQIHLKVPRESYTIIYQCISL